MPLGPLLKKSRKTQDVLDYVYELHGQLALSVFWIFAGNAARFEQDYRKLAVLLQLPDHDDMKTDIRHVR